MSLLAASLVGFGFTSCSHDDVYDSTRTKVQDAYNDAFVKNFGKPASNQDWGFGTASSSAPLFTFTRAITVNGDNYAAFNFPTNEELTAAFPTAIPADADEVSELLDKYQGTTVQTQWGEATLWDIYAIYANKIVEGYNLKITQAGTTELGGSYQNAGWDSERGMEVARPYNVFVDVDGDVTIKRNGATHFNLYILRGNVTLESDYGEQAGSISVAAGATLNDERNSIAANQGIKLYNRGTVNATNTQKYDIGNFSTVYNEGKFNVDGPLTYSPGDANTSYFVNFGDDAELTAPAMTLNSSCHFYNSGNVEIEGNTFVTQTGINWINNGFYKTGAMTFSAKNNTFYNYCQLIVTGKAHMFDGEFSLMQNSYTEAGTAEMDNFIVNMASNTGMYIKGNVRMIAQGDGTYQGFRTVSGSNDYLLIDGKVTVDAHYHTFSVSSGITYSVNAIEIVRDGNVVTEEYLQEVGDGAYPVLDFNGTECSYGNLTVTPNDNTCGATWHIEEIDDINPDIRIIAEDLSINDASDFDFNDVVFDVAFTSSSTATVVLRAAGGTLPLRFMEKDEWEVHKLFGVSTNVMVNTAATARGYQTVQGADNIPAKTIYVTGIDRDKNGKDIKIEVKKGDTWYPITAEQGEPAAKLAVDPKFQWVMEKVELSSIYNRFSGWVQNPDVKWY